MEKCANRCLQTLNIRNDFQHQILLHRLISLRCGGCNQNINHIGEIHTVLSCGCVTHYGCSLIAHNFEICHVNEISSNRWLKAIAAHLFYLPYNRDIGEYSFSNIRMLVKNSGVGFIAFQQGQLILYVTDEFRFNSIFFKINPGILKEIETANVVFAFDIPRVEKAVAEMKNCRIEGSDDERAQVQDVCPEAPNLSAQAEKYIVQAQARALKRIFQFCFFEVHQRDRGGMFFSPRRFPKKAILEQWLKEESKKRDLCGLNQLYQQLVGMYEIFVSSRPCSLPCNTFMMFSNVRMLMELRTYIYSKITDRNQIIDALVNWIACSWQSKYLEYSQQHSRSSLESDLEVIQGTE